MTFYSEHVLPRVIDRSMRSGELRPYRERVVSRAEGRVLEVGVGSGLNLPFYGARVAEVVGLEPSARLLAMARSRIGQSRAPAGFIEGSAESIPLEDRSIDTVVMTWTLCSIPDAARALAEMRRVLEPTGQLLFVEHGLAPEDDVRRWQHRLTPLWKKIGGGCHLNRPIRSLIEDAGFRIRQIETAYMKGPKPLTFIYEGRAKLPQRTSVGDIYRRRM